MNKKEYIVKNRYNINLDPTSPKIDKNKPFPLNSGMSQMYPLFIQ
jgi:hypothetical protein